MMPNQNNRGPHAWGRGGGPGRGRRTLASLQDSISQHPVAIAWQKGGRSVVLGKLLRLDGAPTLATAYRWRLLPAAVSLPEEAIRALVRLGVRRWLVRDDLRRLAWEVDLLQLLREGRPQGGERYVRLDDACPVPWPDWPYAERVVELQELAGGAAVGASQLRLALEGAGP